jgi:hypothetical protein
MLQDMTVEWIDVEIRSNPTKGGGFGGGCGEKQPLGLKSKRLESKTPVELGRTLVLRVHHDREDSDGTPGPQDALDRIRQEKLPDTLPACSFVAREPADQGGRNRAVARQLAGYILRQTFQGEGQRAETVEAEDSQIRRDRDEDSRDIPLLILACPAAEPVVEIRLAARELRSIVMLAKRLDHDLQRDSPLQLSMSLQGGNELFGRFGWVHQGREKQIPIRPHQHHPLVLVENPAGSFVGQIAGRESGDRHCALDEQLGRRSDTKLDAFSLELSVGGWMAAC